MKEIIILYWRERNLIPGLGHYSIFKYSIKKRNEIVQTIVNHNFSVMIRPNLGETRDTLYIFIDKNDKRSFQQS